MDSSICAEVKKRCNLGAKAKHMNCIPEFLEIHRIEYAVLNLSEAKKTPQRKDFETENESKIQETRRGI
jgi:hypothetical protein